MQRVVKALNELDCCTLAASRSPNKCDVSARLDSEVQSTEDTSTRASRITEMNVLEYDLSAHVAEHFSFCRLSVNLRNRFDQSDDVGPGTFSRRYIGHI